jgi:antitoxin FitA
MTQSPPDLDDGFARWLDSRPEDDEPLSRDERAALARSDADIAAGRTVSLEAIKAINRTTADLPADHAFTDAAAAALVTGLGGTCKLGVAQASRYTEGMKTIQVRNVPDDVHRALRTRAAAAGVSLSDFALGELERAAQRPPVAELLQRARSRAGGASSRAIVAAVRSGRDRA